MMALHQVELTGRGQVIDASIYESVLNMMENIVTEYDVGDYIRERTGSFLPKIAPSNIYPTKDGIWLVIGANQDSVWARMAEAMDRPELATDERYATHGARGINQIELDEFISEWTKTFSVADLEERLNEFGIPNGKIYRPPEMLEDPQFQARDSIVRVDHPELGNIAMQEKRLHDAHALFLAAQALRRINGSVSLLAHSAGNIAGVLALKGDWENSAEAFQEVAEQWASLGNSEMELIGRLNLIECLLEMDTPPDAERKNRINALLEASDKLLKPLCSPQLEGILAGHRERALSVFALSSEQNFQ